MGDEHDTTSSSIRPLTEIAVVQQRELGWDHLVDEARRIGPGPTFAACDDTDVEAQLHAAAEAATRATAHYLDVLAEFVVRGVWADQGARTPGVWLSWQLGVAPQTAREHTRVALRLRELPAVRRRFAAGTLSYSKVRALTRIALPDHEQLLLSWADHATAAELEQIARGFRAAQRGRTAGPDGASSRRSVTVRAHHDGTASLVLRAPVEEVAELEQRLRSNARHHLAHTSDDAADDTDADAGGRVDTSDLPVDARQERQWPSSDDLAEALVTAVLAGTGDQAPDTSGQDRHTLVVQVPAEALTAADGPVAVHDATGRVRALPVSTLQRLGCEAGVVAVVTGDDGGPLDVGRRRRTLSAALRRAVLLRDRHRCRFPGCGATRHLHAHHAVHWARGGPTAIGNLVVLCGHHHRFVHEHDLTIEVRTDGRHRFRSSATDATDATGATGAASPTSATAGPRTGIPTTEPAERHADPLPPDDTSTDHGRRAALAPVHWDGPGEADVDLAVAVLQGEVDRAAPELAHRWAA